MKKCLIITGGSVDISFASNFLKDQKWEMVIAADKGLEACIQLGISVDNILGDMDSVNPDILKVAQTAGMKLLQYPSEKDAADTELAVQTAIAQGAEKIFILGATGTRLDHTWANIHILWQAQNAGVQAVIADAHNRIQLLSKGEHILYKKDCFGQYISFLPFKGDVRHVHLSGFRYSGTDIDFLYGCSLGVSNEIIQEKAKISFAQGHLLMIESVD